MREYILREKTLDVLVIMACCIVIFSAIALCFVPYKPNAVDAAGREMQVYHLRGTGEINVDFDPRRDAEVYDISLSLADDPNTGPLLVYIGYGESIYPMFTDASPDEADMRVDWRAGPHFIGQDETLTVYMPDNGDAVEFDDGNTWQLRIEAGPGGTLE